MSACLNCGAALTGPFCAACGQRDVPAYPTVREMAGDAWEEFSGWDGRLARTLGTLLRRPGQLTVDALEGRRARHIKPLRLYLVVSVIYFLLAVGGPNVRVTDTSTGETRDVTVGVSVWTPDRDGMDLSPEERAALDREIAESPAFLRPVLSALAADPAGFESRLLAAMPKVFFVLVPMFGGVVALFYRRRPFPQHLIFALHLHAVMFLALGAARLLNIVGSVWLSVAVGVAALLFIAQYWLRAFRRVYGNGWLVTLLKIAAIIAVYGLLFMPAMMAAMAWAAFWR